MSATIHTPSSVTNALALSFTNAQASSPNNNSEITVSAAAPSSNFQGTITFRQKSFKINTRLFSTWYYHLSRNYT
ncbi:hypothetical protein PQX77_002243, partial [Marasmius sp. AFHP31]